MPVLTPLQRSDFPGDGYVTLLVHIEVPAGELIGRHTHPGLEITYLLEGEATILVDGHPPRVLKPGDSFAVPADLPHSVQNGQTVARAIASYVVEKDRPLVNWV